MLELRGIQKRFGGVVALRKGDLAVQSGEIHLLLGENGAGKSTLMKITAGMQGFDGGEMLWRGQAVTFRNPAEAASVGVAMVHQESLLAPHLSIAENIYLGREPRGPFGYVDRAKAIRAARALIEEHRFPLEAEWRVERLSPAGKQLVEICRAVAHGSSLLIFDEPTSSLSEHESAEVFRIARTLRDRGSAVIYITHRLEELRKLGDRVTVLRDGETVHTGALAETTTTKLIQHMVGREIPTLYQREPVAPGDMLLRVQALTRRPLLKDISLSVRAGEIVGLAGLIGAGRTELCRAIFGIDAFDSGTVEVMGQALRGGSPREALFRGLALIPEDRQRTGLAAGLSVGQNMTLASLPALSSMGVVNRAREQAVIREQTERLRLKADSPRQPAGKLSGGNQQKVVISKWITRGASILLFDEPTRGIDIGAKTEVFRLMDELARSGRAILMVSSELPELLQVADRILVMRQGRISAELPGKTTQEEILRCAALDSARGT